MTFPYAATAQTATRLLERFGAAATLKRQTTGAYDPVLGYAPVTTTSHATTAAVFAYPQGFIDGTNILQGDRRAYCAPGAEPKQGDVLTWQGTDLAVVSVKPVSPAGLAVIYEVQVRG